MKILRSFCLLATILWPSCLGQKPTERVPGAVVENGSAAGNQFLSRGFFENGLRGLEMMTGAAEGGNGYGGEVQKMAMMMMMKKKTHMTPVSKGGKMTRAGKKGSSDVDSDSSDDSDSCDEAFDINERVPNTKLETRPYLQDNFLYFHFHDNNSADIVDFKCDFLDFHITPGQPKGQYTCQMGQDTDGESVGVIYIQAGHKNSPKMADKFNDGLTTDNMMVTWDGGVPHKEGVKPTFLSSSDPPTELHFVVTVNIYVTTESGVEYMVASNLRVAQGKTLFVDNWWLGADNCDNLQSHSTDTSTPILMPLACNYNAGEFVASGSPRNVYLVTVPVDGLYIFDNSGGFFKTAFQFIEDVYEWTAAEIDDINEKIKNDLENVVAITGDLEEDFENKEKWVEAFVDTYNILKDAVQGDVCGVCENIMGLIDDLIFGTKTVSEAEETLCDASCTGIVQFVGLGPEDPVADFFTALCPMLCVVLVSVLIDKIYGDVFEQGACAELDICPQPVPDNRLL